MIVYSVQICRPATIVPESSVVDLRTVCTEVVIVTILGGKFHSVMWKHFPVISKHVSSIKFNAFLNHIVRYKPLIFKHVNLTRHVYQSANNFLIIPINRIIKDCKIWNIENSYESTGLNRFTPVKVKGVSSIASVSTHCQLKLLVFGADLEIVVFSVGCFVIPVHHINPEHQIGPVGGYIVQPFRSPPVAAAEVSESDLIIVPVTVEIYDTSHTSANRANNVLSSSLNQRYYN